MVSSRRTGTRRSSPASWASAARPSSRRSRSTACRRTRRGRSPHASCDGPHRPPVAEGASSGVRICGGARVLRDLNSILFVDDDPDTQEVVRLALETLGGLNVKAVSSGAEAMRIAPRFCPDLILLDLVMPEMDGRATLKALRGLPETAERLQRRA